MKSFLLLALVAFALCLSVEGIKWTHTNSAGDVVLRSIKIVRGPPTDPNTFEVRGTRVDKTTGVKDLVDFLFSTVGVPRFVTRYFAKDTDSAEAIINRWALWKVFEYVESDGVAGFDPTTENITSSYRLFNRRFDAMEYSKVTATDGTITHYVCTNMNPVNKTIPVPSVRLCAYAAEKDTNTNNTHVSPNSIKWSITISNYPYASTNGRLGLKVSFDSKNAVKDLATTDPSAEDDPTQSALDLSSDDSNASKARGIAAWVTSVSVVGAGCSPSANVVRTVVYDAQVTKDVDVFPADPDSFDASIKIRVSYFAFVTDCTEPSSIEWDPELGVSTTDATSSAFSVRSSFLLLVAMIFVALKL